jgi:Zn-dependent peptidase ImmA (M78 family)
VSAQKLEAVLNESSHLSDDEAIAVAKELAVPVPALFAQEKLPLASVLDLRTEDPHTARFHKGTLQAISFAERISNTLAALGIDVRLDRSVGPVLPNFTVKEAIKLAAKWRDKWNISVNDQLELRDANKLYTSLRSFIEGLGVVVLHQSFESADSSGIYTRINGGSHFIIINTMMSSKSRKLFTLAHEFCHVLLRKEGASNPSVTENKIEKFCNKFAAYLLAPDDLIAVGLEKFRYIPSSNPDFVRLFSTKLGISQEALVWRLIETGYLKQPDYEKWRATFDGPLPPGDMHSGGGGKSDPLQVKRAMYGTLLLRVLEGAKRRGLLDEIDIYRLCGLKPKYQNQLFEVV